MKVPEKQDALWTHAYVEQLRSLQLHTEAAAVLSLSSNARIRAISKGLATTVALYCLSCRKASERVGAWCPCNRAMARCSMCELPVRGRYVWCQGCGHGGHAKHMREWFEGSNECPSGCGCHCTAQDEDVATLAYLQHV